jgi:hypothetical protein
MSLDSRIALLPYESSSFATLKGKQEIVPLTQTHTENFHFPNTRQKFPTFPMERMIL